MHPSYESKTSPLPCGQKRVVPITKETMVFSMVFFFFLAREAAPFLMFRTYFILFKKVEN